MIVGKCSLYQDPKWRLGDKCLCNEESLNILGNVFNRGGHKSLGLSKLSHNIAFSDRLFQIG